MQVVPCVRELWPLEEDTVEDKDCVGGSRLQCRHDGPVGDAVEDGPAERPSPARAERIEEMASEERQVERVAVAAFRRE